MRLAVFEPVLEMKAGGVVDGSRGASSNLELLGGGSQLSPRFPGLELQAVDGHLLGFASSDLWKFFSTRVEVLVLE